MAKAADGIFVCGIWVCPSPVKGTIMSFFNGLLRVSNRDRNGVEYEPLVKATAAVLTGCHNVGRLHGTLRILLLGTPADPRLLPAGEAAGAPAGEAAGAPAGEAAGAPAGEAAGALADKARGNGPHFGWLSDHWEEPPAASFINSVFVEAESDVRNILNLPRATVFISGVSGAVTSALASGPDAPGSGGVFTTSWAVKILTDDGVSLCPLSPARRGGLFRCSDDYQVRNMVVFALKNRWRACSDAVRCRADALTSVVQHVLKLCKVMYCDVVPYNGRETFAHSFYLCLGVGTNLGDDGTGYGDDLLTPRRLVPIFTEMAVARAREVVCALFRLGHAITVFERCSDKPIPRDKVHTLANNAFNVATGDNSVGGDSGGGDSGGGGSGGDAVDTGSAAVNGDAPARLARAGLAERLQQIADTGGKVRTDVLNAAQFGTDGPTARDDDVECGRGHSTLNRMSAAVIGGSSSSSSSSSSSRSHASAFSSWMVDAKSAKEIMAFAWSATKIQNLRLLREKFERALALLRTALGREGTAILQTVELAYDAAGGYYGTYTGRSIVVNLQAFLVNHDDGRAFTVYDFINTLTHEVAHAIHMSEGGSAGHGVAWRGIHCMLLKAVNERCFCPRSVDGALACGVVGACACGFV